MDMVRFCPQPRLWGLSVLGTQLRVYTCNVANRRVTPPADARPNVNLSLPPDFLAGAWNVDIMSQEGFGRMREIVGVIMANVRN
jgi:hypothetical protein